MENKDKPMLVKNIVRKLKEKWEHAHHADQ